MNRISSLAFALCALGGTAVAVMPAAAQSGVIAQTDAEIAKAMASPDLKMVRNVSHQELSAGIPIVEGSGKTIGLVEKVAGNTIIVSDGKKTYRIPIEQIYAYTDGETDRFASRMTKKQLQGTMRR